MLRVWDALRTQQLEFLPEMTPGRLIYHTEKYDFSPEFLDPRTMTREDRLATVRAIARGDYDRLELNEPTMIHLWRRLIPYTVAFRVARTRARLSGSAVPLLVLYAIDNFDARAAFARSGRGPARLRRLVFGGVFRALLRPVDRIAFGTRGSEEMYRSMAGRGLRHVETTMIPELDRPCGCRDSGKDADLVLFVGALDDRKGILQLMAAWPSVVEARPRSRLVIVGKGRYREQVEGWARGRDDVTFVHDPERAEIHRRYRAARVVVLLSQPHPRWREQVGLPITEGLSHGCLLVASTQTGIADWLAGHGHFTIDPAASVAEISRAVCGALDSPKSPAEVVADLPEETTRITADRWLMRRSPL